MTCRFVILKEIDGEPGVFIEYDEKILAERIKARMKEYYYKHDIGNQSRFGMAAFEEAFKLIMTEFK